MPTTTFPLTVRRADTLEVYKAHFRFSLLDPFVLRMALGALCAAGAAVFAYRMMLDNADFAILVFAAGIFFLGFSVAIVVSYVEKRNVKYNTNRWIDTFIDLKDHEMVVEDTRILYRRQFGLFVYPFSEIADFHKDAYCYMIKCRGEQALVLPSKAFAPGDADRFGALVHEKLSHYLAQTAHMDPNLDVSESATASEQSGSSTAQ